MKDSSSFRFGLAGATGTMLLFLACATVHSQEPSQTLNLSPSDYDSYAASQAQDMRHHARPANTPAAKAEHSPELSTLRSESPESTESNASQGASRKGVRFPGDLQFHGGPVVQSTVQHLIFVNLVRGTSCHTIATCWGDPGTFLRDLGNSNFIHVVDQYVGSEEEGRYTVSQTPVSVNYPTGPHPLTNIDILTIVHAVAAVLGTGYGNIYHVFLLPGQDECFDSTFSFCYSPDNPSTFAFCAFHGSVTFRDIGHVLFSLEPFQNVRGCSEKPGTPNGQLIDSTNSVLSHETFEIITDPDLNAWFNSLNLSLFGEEIGDECSFIIFTPTGVFFDPSNVTLDGRKYAAQPEYNNARHACTIRASAPDD
jgi:hypothetical protein